PDAHLIKPFFPFPSPRIRSHRLRSGRGRCVEFRRAATREDELLHEPLHELEPVPQGDLADAGDFRNRLLRTALARCEGSEVDRGRRSPGGRQGHGAIDLLQLLEDLVGFRLDRVREPEPRTEAAHIVRRSGRRHSEGQRPQARPVRLADRLLADAGDLLQLIQRPRDAVDATRGIDRGCHNRFDGPTPDEALLERLLADEPRLVFPGTWQAHQRRGALDDRALADYAATGIADKLAARVVAHEMFAAAFGADPVLFDHRFCRRAARHGMPSARWTSAALVNITRLYYTLSSWPVTTSGPPCWNGGADPFRT